MRITKKIFPLIGFISLSIASLPVKAISYPQGTFSIKPLTMNFANMTFNLRKQDSIINGTSRNAYKGFRGLGFNESVRQGIGYSIELGLTALDDFEVFTVLGVSYETGISNVEVNPAVPAAASQRFLSFKSRTNFNAALGARYYFDWKKNWVPFISGSLGVDFQSPVKATALNTVAGPIIGDFTIQGSKALLKGAVLVGVDYRFDKRWAITFSTGAQYLQRTRSETTTNLSGINVRYKDGGNEWSMPVLVALKISF